MAETNLFDGKAITKEQFFEGGLEIPFINKFSEKTFFIKSISENLEIKPEDYQRIVEICNEKPIYKRFFEKKLNGRPYELEDAKTIVRLGHEGWQKKEWFIFFIYDDEGQITGLLDIYSKPNEKEAVRLGYWNSQKHPGLMSYALGTLLEVAKAAGYKELFATPRADNLSSQKVLENNGFKKEGSYMEDGLEWYRFVIDLTRQANFINEPKGSKIDA